MAEGMSEFEASGDAVRYVSNSWRWRGEGGNLYDKWMLEKTLEWAGKSVEERGRLEFNPHEFMMWRQSQSVEQEGGGWHETQADRGAHDNWKENKGIEK